MFEAGDGDGVPFGFMSSDLKILSADCSFVYVGTIIILQIPYTNRQKSDLRKQADPARTSCVGTGPQFGLKP